MCGIAGIISHQKFDRQQIELLMKSLSHRGPDAQGIYVNDQSTVALGHTRLSILDLSDKANQPFASADKRYQIVYNGEIYNYLSIRKELESQGVKFRTTSDTEVLIEAFSAWGEKMVNRLEGMFSFVIYDVQENKIFIFRDRVGKKPLYYYLHEGLFVFASEIKSVLMVDAVRQNSRINKSVISTFLQVGYIPEPDTIYDHVYKFPSGHTGILSSNGKLTIQSYWDIHSKIHPIAPFDSHTVKDELKRKLETAVSKRLISDVPLGVFLSGGIDSSLITVLTSKLKLEKVKTFTIGFSDSRFDESSYARQIANYLNTDHHNYYLPDKQIAEMLNDYIEHFHEPFADTSAIPTMLVSALAKKEVSVVLTGDGGDELFLGYGSYVWAERLANPMIRRVGRILQPAFQKFGSDKLKRASHLFDTIEQNTLRKHIFSQEQYLFSAKELNDLLVNPENFANWLYTDPETSQNLTEAEKQALFDFQYYLKDDLLVKIDRASMRYGLECRCPLLDHDVVEYAINLPERFKLRGNTSKVLLKEILFEMIPSEFFNRPKQGFSIPMQKWLKTDLSHLLNYLSKQSIEQTGLFKFDYVQNLIRRFNNDEAYLYNRLWALIIIQKFLIENKFG